MNKRLFALTAVAASLVAGAAAAQDNHQGHGAHGASTLPAACLAAAKPAAAELDATAGGMSGAMGAMHAGMMAAETIPDPDLSFNCGMIAHHQGAIAMAETELKNGKDEASKAMAQRIIEAQKREIAEMTARVEALAK